MYINSPKQTDSCPTWPLVEKFNSDIFYVDVTDRDYEESDALRQIGIVYQRLSEFSKAKEVYMRIIRVRE